MRRALIHDTNVRVVPETRPPGRRTARRWRLARLLLSRTVGVAGLAALLSPMPACITPVAPDFQDPAAFPQVAPWIHDEGPTFGHVVSVVAGKDAVKFSVQVTDLNVTDHLYSRWVLNPPAPDSDSDPSLQTVILSSQEEHMKLLSTVWLVEQDIGCLPVGETWKTNSLAQQLELIVADGLFVDPEFDSVDPLKTRKSYANWTIHLECSGAAAASP
jgi:hypothetical protein